MGLQLTQRQRPAARRSHPSHRFGPVGLRCTALLAVASLAIGMAGCAGPGSPISEASRLRAAQQQLPPPGDADFPSPRSVLWAQGATADPARLALMRRGLGKDEVRELLGTPHFRAGLAGVREWNYLLHFRDASGAARRTCQYMVRFNRDILVSGVHWRDPECELLANPPVAWPLDAAGDARPAVARIVLSADGLFGDAPGATELQAEGRRKLERLSGEVRRAFPPDAIVLVTGHADRLEAATAPGLEVLSLARAESVRAFLVDQGGLASAAVRAIGMGDRRPATAECADEHRPGPGLRRCLRPDRRIEIEIVGAA